MSTVTKDPVTYALFGRIIREAREAVYEISFTKEAWGKTIRSTRREGDRDKLPWDQIDEIEKAIWYTGQVNNAFGRRISLHGR